MTRSSGRKPREPFDPEPFDVIVLGCGTSTGVPVLACDCAVCRSGDPKNQRTRSSVALVSGCRPADRSHPTRPTSKATTRVLLIDTTPDLRQQCLREGIERVDAVLFTHAHADHVFGLDDLRPYGFRQGEPIPCHGSASTLGQIRDTFAYAFDGVASEGGGKPRLTLHAETGAFEAAGFPVEPIPVHHGRTEVTAYRVGDFAYVTDCSAVEPASVEALAGVDTLICDALRYRPHPTHFSVDEAIAFSRRLGARRTVLTHMAHDIDYNVPSGSLPTGVEFAYDGLRLPIR